MKSCKRSVLTRFAALALSAAMVLMMIPASALAAVPSGTAKVTVGPAPVEDGVYRGKVNMMNASNLEQYSMGNAALRGSDTFKNRYTSDADYQTLVVVEDGKATAVMEYMPLSFLGTYGFMLELGQLHVSTANAYGWPKSDTTTYTEAQVLTYHKTSDGKVVYDSYNDPSSEYVYDGTNATRPAFYDQESEPVNISGQAYPWLVAVDVTPVAVGTVDSEEAPSLPETLTVSNSSYNHVFVPVMFSIQASSGDQDARIQVDWENLKKVDDPDSDLQYQLYAAAQIKQESASDEAYAALQTAISEVESAMSNRWPSQQLTVDGTSIILNYSAISEKESADLIAKLKQAEQNLTGPVWDGTTVSQPKIENGVAYIYTAEELAWIAQTENNKQNNQNELYDKISIENDINLNNREWPVIGAMKASVEGNNHTISGLSVTSAYTGDYAGLIGKLGGSSSVQYFVRNLTVKGSVSPSASTQQAGGIVGLAQNVSFYNCVNEADVTNNCTKSSKAKTGGIVGELSYANDKTKNSITKCVNNGDIQTTADISVGIWSTGGVAGYAVNTDISKCANNGNLDAGGNMGGIVGDFYGYSADCALTDCYNTGSVTSSKYITSKMVGGVIGQVREKDSYNMTVCGIYNRGTVSKTSAARSDGYFGGLLGGATSSQNTAEQVKVSQGYTTGEMNVSTAGKDGLIVGMNFAGTYSNLYALWDGVSSYTLHDGYDTNCVYTDLDVCRESELKSKAVGSHFVADSENINDGYPILIFQSSDSFAAAKEAALDELNNYIDINDYRSLAKKAAQAALADGLSKVESAATAQEVETALQAAKTALDAINPSDVNYGLDLTSVQPALDNAKPYYDIVTGDANVYTNSSSFQVKTWYGYVQNGLKNGFSTQANVTNYVEKLNNAVAGLEYLAADYTQVNAQIERYHALDSEDFYKNFADVKTAYEQIDLTKNITEQAAVDTMAEALKTAIDGLEYKDADYTSVNEALEKVNAIKDRDRYKDLSAIDDAVAAVVEGKNIKEQDEVDAMAKAISDALASVAADYSKVRAAVEKYERLVRDQYNNLTAVDAAKDSIVYDLDITNQSAVDKMAQDMEDAIANLTFKPADYTVVTHALEMIPDDLSGYSDASVEALDKAKKALDFGKTVNEQDDVNAMAQAIKDAVDGLEAKADYTAVDQAIKKAEAYDTSLYTNYMDVLNAIAAVDRGKGISQQAEVDAMAQKIEAAIAALQLKETKAPADQSQNQNQTQAPASVASITLSKTSYKYNKKVRKPSVIVKDANGNDVAGNYYTVTYSNGKSKKPGVYTVKVTFNGVYQNTPEQTLTYKIKPAKVKKVKVRKTAANGVKVSWAKASGITKYQIQYSTNKKFKKSATKKVNVSAKVKSKKIMRLSHDKKYYVRVRSYKTVKVNGKKVKLYSKWSSAVSFRTK